MIGPSWISTTCCTRSVPNASSSCGIVHHQFTADLEAFERRLVLVTLAASDGAFDANEAPKAGQLDPPAIASTNDVNSFMTRASTLETKPRNVLASSTTTSTRTRTNGRILYCPGHHSNRSAIRNHQGTRQQHSPPPPPPTRS